MYPKFLSAKCWPSCLHGWVRENMSPCTGSRVNTNNDRIAPCDGVCLKPRPIDVRGTFSPPTAMACVLTTRPLKTDANSSLTIGIYPAASAVNGDIFSCRSYTKFEVQICNRSVCSMFICEISQTNCPNYLSSSLGWFMTWYPLCRMLLYLTYIFRLVIYIYICIIIYLIQNYQDIFQEIWVKAQIRIWT